MNISMSILSFVIYNLRRTIRILNLTYIFSVSLPISKPSFELRGFRDIFHFGLTGELASRILAT